MIININNVQPLVISQIFTLFYAVLYGAIFTLSDRWRPFYRYSKEPNGFKRLLLSLVFLGLLPVLYFCLMIQILLNITCSVNILNTFAIIYAVAPLGSLYILWTFIIRRWYKSFYSDHELSLEPIKSTLEWGGPVSKESVIFFLFGFDFLPIILLIVIL